MSFDPLGLTPELLRAVADQGYTEPTPIQRAAIPLVLAGRDVLAGAQTGTGKTAAFVLPILQRLADSQRVVTGPTSRDRRDAVRPPVRVLVLTPTRELALQVERSVRTYGAHRRIRSTAIYGGVGFDPQVRALRAAPSVVVATPGRLLDHASQGTVDLSRVEVLVLDEADRMLDMGFIRDIRRVLDLVPATRQSLLFSATFSDDVRRLAATLLDNPASVEVTPRNTATELVSQVVHPVDRRRKRELLSHLIRSGRIEQALVFTRTKHGANHLAEQLQRDGIAATAIHGNKSQGQRVRALDDFKAGRATILVATEVASRGLDIDSLPHVVNFELPLVAEDYVHRIGRTGRAGATGDAISLVCVDEQGLLRDIEALLRKRIPSEIIEGFEPDRSIRPEPIRRGPQGPRPTNGHGGRRAQGGPVRRGAPVRNAGATQPRHTRPDYRSPGVAHAPAGADRTGAGAQRSGRATPRPANATGRSQDGRHHQKGSVGIGNAPAGFGERRPAANRHARPAHHRPGMNQPRSQAGHRTLPGERLQRSNAGR
ncbi:MAG TPA: DEAD/DEAH box helicase [Candidatus Limnocylindrales bacterium]|nr:DEAD/DEAH box helicase [Candidatus Limnocylindrales bacterium]